MFMMLLEVVACFVLGRDSVCDNGNLLSMFFKRLSQYIFVMLWLDSVSYFVCGTKFSDSLRVFNVLPYVVILYHSLKRFSTVTD